MSRTHGSPSSCNEARQLGWVSTRSILGHGTNESPEFLQKFTFLQHLRPTISTRSGPRASGSRPGQPFRTLSIPTSSIPDGGCHAGRPGIPEAGLVVLSVAAIKRDQKRIDYLLDEFGRLPKWNPYFRSGSSSRVGGSQTPTNWSTRPRDARRPRSIPGRFPREPMPELYRMADVFARCSYREMMPIALIEATVSGLPCLVHRQEVLEWIVGPGGDSIDMSTSGPSLRPRNACCSNRIGASNWATGLGTTAWIISAKIASWTSS